VQLQVGDSGVNEVHVVKGLRVGRRKKRGQGGRERRGEGRKGRGREGRKGGTIEGKRRRTRGVKVKQRGHLLIELHCVQHKVLWRQRRWTPPSHFCKVY